MEQVTEVLEDRLLGLSEQELSRLYHILRTWITQNDDPLNAEQVYYLLTVPEHGCTFYEIFKKRYYWGHDRSGDICDLVKKGFIEKARAPNDGRKRVISITEAGVSIKKKYRPIAVAFLRS